MMIRCCIFDLDGTLIDTIRSLTYITNLTMLDYGFQPVEEEQIKLMVGNGYKKLVESALLYCGDKELRCYEAALETYMEHFKIHYLHDIHTYDGIPQLLEWLKNQGIKLAVLSNKPHDRTVDTIESVFGKGYFDRVAGEKAEVPRKPDPAGAYITAKELGVAMDECLYFGDTNTDMQTGLASGMVTVGVTWGFRDRAELEEYNPQHIISHPLEAVSILKGINAIQV